MSIGTISAGSANVTCSGNLNSGLVFNFALQTGATGSLGPQGPQGNSIVGPIGDKGDSGDSSAADSAAAAASAAASDVSASSAEATCLAFGTRLDADEAEIATLNADADNLQLLTTGMSRNATTSTTSFDNLTVTSASDFVRDVLMGGNLSVNGISSSSGGLNFSDLTATQTIRGANVYIGNPLQTSVIYLNGTVIMPSTYTITNQINLVGF